MDIIIDTDLGRDPDDFLAITWLLAVGYNIKAIVISPGHEDQVAVAKFILNRLGLTIPVGVSKPDKTKSSSGGSHYKILERYKFAKEAKEDGLGWDIINSVYHENMELITIGPPTNTGGFLFGNDKIFKKITMQGGFLPYSLYSPQNILDKFVGKNTIRTFNFGGDTRSTNIILERNCHERRIVGKNVCHTVVCDKEKLKNFKPHNDAAKLFVEFLTLHLDKKEGKAMHDPIACACHHEPNIGCWLKGNPVQYKNEWGTELDPNGSDILGDLNHKLFWEKMYEFR